MIMQKKLTEIAINDYKTKNTAVGDTLHENFAQTLAGIKLFLETAEKPTSVSSYFIKKSKESIGDMIVEMRNLAKTIYASGLMNPYS